MAGGDLKSVLLCSILIISLTILLTEGSSKDWAGVNSAAKKLKKKQSGQRSSGSLVSIKFNNNNNNLLLQYQLNICKNVLIVDSKKEGGRI